MKIYVICEPCDDSYYPGHPTGVAFYDKEQAKAYCDAKSGGNPEDDSHYYDYAYYFHEVEVL